MPIVKKETLGMKIDYRLNTKCIVSKRVKLHSTKYPNQTTPGYQRSKALSFDSSFGDKEMTTFAFHSISRLSVVIPSFPAVVTGYNNDHSGHYGGNWNDVALRTSGYSGRSRKYFLIFRGWEERRYKKSCEEHETWVKYRLFNIF